MIFIELETRAIAARLDVSNHRPNEPKHTRRSQNAPIFDVDAYRSLCGADAEAGGWQHAPSILDDEWSGPSFQMKRPW